VASEGGESQRAKMFAQWWHRDRASERVLFLKEYGVNPDRFKPGSNLDQALTIAITEWSHHSRAASRAKIYYTIAQIAAPVAAAI